MNVRTRYEVDMNPLGSEGLNSDEAFGCILKTLGVYLSLGCVD